MPGMSTLPSKSMNDSGCLLSTVLAFDWMSRIETVCAGEDSRTLRTKRRARIEQGTYAIVIYNSFIYIYIYI
ncbi:hypothetical protein LguiA_035188 [Lonicera macranthoides]